MVIHITVTGTGSEIVSQLKQLAAALASNGTEPPKPAAPRAAIRPEEGTEPANPVGSGPPLRVHEGESERAPGDEPATLMQIRAVFGIAKRLGIEPDALRAVVRSQLGHGVSAATKGEMSRIITDLQRTPAPEAPRASA